MFGKLIRLVAALWRDQSGAILSAEAALLGTVGIVGAGVGLSAVRHSISDELAETAYAIRSFDQSFSYDGLKCGTAWTAGSSYQQPPVAEAHQQLRREIENARRDEKKRERNPEIQKPKQDKRKNAVDIEIPDSDEFVTISHAGESSGSQPD